MNKLNFVKKKLGAFDDKNTTSVAPLRTVSCLFIAQVVVFDYHIQTCLDLSIVLLLEQYSSF